MALPKLIMKNQFGEQSNNYILAGSDQIDINFVVDSANGNGLGTRSLKSASLFANGGAAAVYMHTSATPAAGNPNPAVGLIKVVFAKAYAGYVGGYAGFVSPVSGSAVTSTTAGLAYTIVSLGTTTLAQWVAAGLDIGETPAVGSTFIAIATGAIGGTGAVEVPATSGSGISEIDVIGNPNLSIGLASGGVVICRCLAPTDASTTTQIATAPVDGTVIGMRFVMTALAGT